MPFTPFHLGAGMLLKTAVRQRFSLLVFAWSQVVMDIQPLLVMLTGEGHLHGFTHTVPGAALLALVAAPTGRYLLSRARLGGWLPGAERLCITGPVALFSAVIGTFSHLLLDALMHSDLEPLAPLFPGNPLHGLVSLALLHGLLLGGGLLGALGYWLVQRRG